MVKDEPMDVEEKTDDTLALPDSTYNVNDDLVSGECIVKENKEKVWECVHGQSLKWRILKTETNTYILLLPHERF